MFCDIQLSQSYANVYIRDTKYIALLRSCFYRLSTRIYTSFAISHPEEDCNQDVSVNQTSEANTGKGTTMSAHVYRCKGSSAYISNNISHVSVSNNHHGVSIGRVPDEIYTVTMSQVVGSGTGTCFYTFLQTHPISISNINFINNTSKSPYGFFGNDRSNDCKLVKCCLRICEGTVWFRSYVANACKCSFEDSVFSGYLPPLHSYVGTSSLKSTNMLSTVGVKGVKAGLCGNGSSNFSTKSMLHMGKLIKIEIYCLCEHSKHLVLTTGT